MGYSGRYHAASLAAVFVALAIGILIGVGFGSDVVTGTAENLEESLGADLGEARAEIEDLEAALDREAEFGRLVYPALVADRLSGREIALVALGDLDDDLTDEVRSALSSAGATLREIAVVREPPDPAAVAAAIGAQGRRDVPRGAALERGARQGGRLLITGGRAFDALRDALLSRYSGSPGGVDGVVLVRTRPAELSPRAAADTDQLEQALIEGLQSGGRTRLPVVGAERTDTEPSSIQFFADQGVASVDNLDQLPGRVALVFALGGAEGNFGVKETADSLLPDLLAPVGLRFGPGRRD